MFVFRLSLVWARLFDLIPRQSLSLGGSQFPKSKEGLEIAHPMWFGAILWVDVVVVSRLASRVFCEFSGFPSSTKTNTPNSKSTRIEDPHKLEMWPVL